MITVKDIMNFMDGFCPPTLSFDRDNVGLIVGRDDKEVKRILITLDVDEKVAAEAKELCADMIISHHPLMFCPIKRLTEKTPQERTLISLVKGDIPLFSAHTNLDCVCGGLNDYLASKLGIEETAVLEVVAQGTATEHGFGRIGFVKGAVTLEDMITRCKSALDTPFVKYTGDLKRTIKKVGVNCGAGADGIDLCIQNGCDLFITGDVKYNPARDCYENGMALIDAGHFETEHIVCELLESVLKREFPLVEFIVSKENIPVWNYR